jgi:hypothetical protein
VLVTSIANDATEIVVNLMHTLGATYELWLPDKPAIYTKDMDDAHCDRFNRTLFSARGYRIIHPLAEPMAIAHHLSVSIVLASGRLHVCRSDKGSGALLYNASSKIEEFGYDG